MGEIIVTTSSDLETGVFNVNNIKKARHILQVITAGLMRKLQVLPQVTGTVDGSMDSHSARIFNIYVLV